jgi:hypothetical protein
MKMILAMFVIHAIIPVKGVKVLLNMIALNVHNHFIGGEMAFAPKQPSKVNMDITRIVHSFPVPKAAVPVLMRKFASNAKSDIT